jgi:hypothetical protein
MFNQHYRPAVQQGQEDKIEFGFRQFGRLARL